MINARRQLADGRVLVWSPVTRHHSATADHTYMLDGERISQADAEQLLDADYARLTLAAMKALGEELGRD